MMPEETRVLRNVDHGPDHKPHRYEITIVRESYRTLETEVVTRVVETGVVIETRRAKEKNVLAGFGETFWTDVLAKDATQIKLLPEYAPAAEKVRKALDAWKQTVPPKDLTAPADVLES